MNELMIAHGEFVHKKPVMFDFISHWLDVYNNQKLAPFGITHSQAKILVRLSHAENGRIAQSELKAIGRRGSTITSLLANLEKGGFIKRTASESDARAKFIEITEKGRLVQQQAFKNILELDDMIDSTLTPEEAKSLQEILVKLSDRVRQERLCKKEKTEEGNDKL